MLAPPDKPTRMVVIDFGCVAIRQKGETKKEWANGVKADVSLLRISLEKKLGIELNNDGTPRGPRKGQLFMWGFIPFFGFQNAQITSRYLDGHVGCAVSLVLDPPPAIECSSPSPSASLRPYLHLTPLSRYYRIFFSLVPCFTTCDSHSGWPRVLLTTHSRRRRTIDRRLKRLQLVPQRQTNNHCLPIHQESYEVSNGIWLEGQAKLTHSVPGGRRRRGRM